MQDRAQLGRALRKRAWAARNKDLIAPPAPGDAFRTACFDNMLAAVHLPLLELSLTADWPAATRLLLPGRNSDPTTWAPVLAWAIFRALPFPARARLFDDLHLRTVLGESFAAIGLPGDAPWRAAARVRLLLAHPGSPVDAVASPAFWADGDVRWLAGVNESGGKSWFNKEQFEELWGWLQLPALVAAAERKALAGDSTVEIETPIAAVCEFAAEAGYELSSFLDLLAPPAPAATESPLPPPLQSSAEAAIPAPS